MHKLQISVKSGEEKWQIQISKKADLISLMKNLSFLPIQAMGALNIPEDERAMFQKLLSHDQTISTWNNIIYNITYNLKNCQSVVMTRTGYYLSKYFL